ERAVGSLRPLELAIALGEVRERVENARVRRIDLRGQVELRERLGALRHAREHAGELEMHEGSIFGLAMTVASDLRAQNLRGLLGTLGLEERARKLEPGGRVLGIELDRADQQGDGRG